MILVSNKIGIIKIAITKIAKIILFGFHEQVF